MISRNRDTSFLMKAYKFGQSIQDKSIIEKTEKKFMKIRFDLATAQCLLAN